ncbi:small integral membrane protein 3 isoform X1 [Mus musculus]|uniref:small integral membrane protein 3 isoform X1 n=1 Tax=Mus musculus TaxID=10090 RepID=UPI001678E58F|nr:small integral membrane protein 3 isoform X1 [Mus musculus]
MSCSTEALKLTPQNIRTLGLLHKKVWGFPLLPWKGENGIRVKPCQGSETQTKVQTGWARGWTPVAADQDIKLLANTSAACLSASCHADYGLTLRNGPTWTLSPNPLWMPCFPSTSWISGP